MYHIDFDNKTFFINGRLMKAGNDVIPVGDYGCDYLNYRSKSGYPVRYCGQIIGYVDDPTEENIYNVYQKYMLGVML